MGEDYIAFGEEWKKEMMKLPKKFLIDMFKDKAIEFESLQAENKELKAKLEAAVKESITLYNLGYKSGHHDTVEGGYTDLLWDDMETYHEEEVKELISMLREKEE